MRLIPYLLFSIAASAFAAGSLPLMFVPNAGQVPADVAYLVHSPDFHAGFARDGAIFQVEGMHVRVRFAGANTDAQIEGTARLSGRANFLLGDDSTWRTGLPVYEGIVYRNLYPGIDAIYSGTTRSLKSEFAVAPGADPRLIRMEYTEAGEVFVNATGELVVRANGVELREEAPLVYQEAADGTRMPVTAAYEIDGNTVSFRLGEYDASRPLVIDPTISYSTYLGGYGMGAVTGLARDGAGNLYVTGWTESLNFPISGAYQAINRGGVDAFVVKLNPTGSSLMYATYIGGSGDDRAFGIAVDSAGQAHVAGWTASSNFPLAVPARSAMQGGREAFVLKLSALGNGLLYSTFLGGASYDAAQAIALDGSGNAYVAGNTQSANFTLLNPVQAAIGGNMDAFITKLTATGVISFSTFLGGAGNENAAGIAADSSGNAYVSGGTESANFPTVGAIQTLAGGQDAFVTKIKTSAATQIVYSTFLGGSGGSSFSPEQASGIAVDAAGNAYVTGTTPSANFPVTSGALQTALSGSRDAFVTKINPAGNTRVYSTYLGGTNFDWANAIAVDPNGNAYVAGYTNSQGFPSIGAVQGGFNGLHDAFIAQLNNTGNALAFSTLLGGAGSDQASAIAVDDSGNIFVGGQTGSANFPMQNAIQTINGGTTGWVARLGVTAPPVQSPSADSASILLSSGGAATITANFSHPAGVSNLTTVAVLISPAASVDYACYVTYDRQANTLRLANDVASSGGIDLTPGSGTAQNSQCTLTGAGSSATTSGNTLTLILKLTLQPGFPQPATNAVYLYAADVNTNTGWVSKGGLPQPSVDSVSPASGSGGSQTFTFVYSDTQSALNISALAILFRDSLTFTNSCYIVYDRAAQRVQLLYDNMLGSSSRAIDSSTVLQNSQCSLGAFSVAVQGLSNVVTASISFKGSFNGSKNIYMAAATATLHTGWVQKGTFTVSTGGAPVANGVSPPAGGGSSGTLTFTVSDAGGSSFINGIAVLISTSTTATNNACYLHYDRAANTVWLSYDTASNGKAPVVLGSSMSTSNSQCTLRGTGSSAVIGETTITLTLNLSFFGAFGGLKNVYLYAAEIGVNTGLVLVGTWNVVGATPTADSVTPSSGTGVDRLFSGTVSDPASASNITGISMILSGGGPNVCYVHYDRTTAQIGLYNDALTTVTYKPLGSSATLQNSRCAVGYSVAVTSGNSVTITVQLVFKIPAFSGFKTVFLQAFTAGASSGWEYKGTWTVP